MGVKLTRKIRLMKVTGLLLAGGQGRRMGGVDKGLQALHGKPMAQWALERLAPQVDEVLINCNQNLDAYARFGHRLGGDQAQRERNAERDQDQLVEQPQHRDEIGDQVDRAERIGDDQDRDEPGGERGTRIAPGVVERQGFALEGAGLGAQRVAEARFRHAFQVSACHERPTHGR